MSSAVAALIAHLTFWILLPYGWFWDEIGPKGVALFLALWLIGYVGLPYLANGGAMFFPYVALLDIALVFIVFKGDVRLN